MQLFVTQFQCYHNVIVVNLEIANTTTVDGTEARQLEAVWTIRRWPDQNVPNSTQN